MNLWRHLFYTLFYLRKPPWDTGISPPELMAFIDSRPPGRALDLGCGTGTNAITLAQHSWQVSAVDFVSSAIRQARRKARLAGVSIDFRQGDVTRLRDLPAGPFDLVLDIGCLHSLALQGKAAYIANLGQVLAAGGVFLVYAFCTQPGSDLMGLEKADLDLLGSTLHLVHRQDGWERQQKPSAWLTYQK